MCLVSLLHTVGQFHSFALVEFCWVIISYAFFSFLSVFVDLYYYFCFSCLGWGIGPCGGVVEPDLVAKMRSDEESGDNFFYGPSGPLQRAW